MKKFIFLALSLALAALLAASCGNKKKAAAEAEAAQAAAEVEQAKQDSIKVEKKFSDLAEEPIFDLVTNYGTIKIKLYKNTPKHRENFAKLALSGFYDGILFHRVIYGFMIQTGDPLTKDMANKSMFGTGGPGYNVPAEFVAAHHHVKGALAAARRGDAANPLRESSGSQFYIVQDPRTCAQLDGQYTVFGETIEGFEVIDKIAGVDTDPRDCPLSPVKIVKVELVK